MQKKLPFFFPHFPLHCCGCDYAASAVSAVESSSVAMGSTADAFSTSYVMMVNL